MIMNKQQERLYNSHYQEKTWHMIISILDLFIQKFLLMSTLVSVLSLSHTKSKSRNGDQSFVDYNTEVNNYSVICMCKLLYIWKRFLLDVIIRVFLHMIYGGVISSVCCVFCPLQIVPGGLYLMVLDFERILIALFKQQPWKPPYTKIHHPLDIGNLHLLQQAQ